MKDYFLKYIYTIFSIYQNKKIASSSVGVSGGYDSIFLLFVLMHIFIIKKQYFVIIHCNHIWQKPNLYMEIEIQKFAYLLNSEICISIPINKLNNEVQSRNWRLNICKRITDYININSLQLGHTGSDQLETLIWHLVRGTSLRGLTSLKNKDCEVYKSYYPNYGQIYNKIKKKQIYWKYISQSCKTSVQIYTVNKKYFFLYLKKNTICIERLLIHNSRLSIKNILNKQKLPYFHDKTNFWIKFMRNRIRILFLPLLRFYVSKSIDKNIIKFRSLIEQDEIFLTHLTFNVINELLYMYVNTNSIVLKKNFLKLPKSLQSRCLNFLLKKYSTKQIDFLVIKKLLNSI